MATDETNAPLEVLRAPQPWMNHPAIITRLFEELDAALARAEAAERKQERGHALVQSTEAMWLMQQKRACVAESRLAEATALLERCRDELDIETDQYSDLCSQELVFDVAAFLSASTTAAESEADERTKAQCDYCGKETLCSTTPGTGGGGLECDPPCAEALQATHIALRECRAELAQTKHDRDFFDAERQREIAALESARAERDSALARIAELEERELPAMKLVAKAYHDALDAAEARIAGLEKRCAAYERGAADHLETRACIAQAVAELEKARNMAPGRWVDECIVAALEALRALAEGEDL